MASASLRSVVHCYMLIIGCGFPLTVLVVRYYNCGVACPLSLVRMCFACSMFFGCNVLLRLFVCMCSFACVLAFVFI